MSSGLLVSVIIGSLGVGGAVGYMAGAATRSKTGTSAHAGVESNTPWFSFEGKTYDTASLPASMQTTLYQAELESFNQKQAMVREFVVRLALSKEQKKFTTIDKVPPLEELLPPPAVTDQEAQAFFEANKERVPPGTTFEQLAGRIKEILGNEKRAQGFNGTLEKLQAEGKFQLLAKEPASPVVNIPVDQFPSKGAAKATHTLVEISDYLCPHCAQMAPQVKELSQKMGEKLKVVQINYSLRPTQLSGTLIEGGFCAQQQSTEAFWKYHDVAFSKPWGTLADPYDVAKAKPIAEGAGIDVAKWETCMASKETKEWMEKTRELVNGLGVTGTPTFYLNNKRINLSSPADLEKLIQAQIAG